MPVVVRDPAAVVSLLRQEVVGRVVRSLEVYGINALKSQSPALTALAGQAVGAVEVRSAAVLVLVLRDMDLEVDLQRAGGVSLLAEAGGWTFGDGSQPTLRLLFEDGSGLDFKEPSRTKRITVRLLDRA